MVSNILIDIPIIGIVIFGLLYYYASTLYPGGSQANLEVIGYDWINNYWCNLMNENAMNGEVNPARPYAIFAMVSLCISLGVFFYLFAEVLTLNNHWRLWIKGSGAVSMIFAALMFTKYHDLMTTLSSIFGLVAVIGIVKEIYNSKWVLYKLTGILGILLLGINNVIYYSTVFIEWLPLIQKFTFVVILFWVLGVNYEIRKKLRQGD